MKTEWRVDLLLLLGLGLIGGGIGVEYGWTWSAMAVGGMLLALGLLSARG